MRDWGKCGVSSSTYKLTSDTSDRCSKSYLTEITSPHNRGLFMGFLNSFYYIGMSEVCMIRCIWLTAARSTSGKWNLHSVRSKREQLVMASPDHAARYVPQVHAGQKSSLIA